MFGMWKSEKKVADSRNIANTHTAAAPGGRGVPRGSNLQAALPGRGRGRAAASRGAGSRGAGSRG
ncbi:hypothetical protein CAQUA_06855 [Corynebacterium aquatimens]|nr:hypothetical protein CAQUA_06855 [Corynebacterium aquatimens]